MGIGTEGYASQRIHGAVELDDAIRGENERRAGRRRGGGRRRGRCRLMGLVPDGAGLHVETVGEEVRAQRPWRNRDEDYEWAAVMWSRPAISRRGRLLAAMFGATYLPRYRRLGWWRLVAGINQGLERVLGGFGSRIAVEPEGRGRLTAADGIVGDVVIVGESACRVRVSRSFAVVDG